MLLKWIFTILAILWVYQAIRPLLTSNPRPPNFRPPSPPPGPEPRPAPKNRLDDEGEYIDYEEIK